MSTIPTSVTKQCLRPAKRSYERNTPLKVFNYVLYQSHQLPIQQ
jgi:hypothetical protein